MASQGSHHAPTVNDKRRTYNQDILINTGHCYTFVGASLSLTCSGIASLILCSHALRALRLVTLRIALLITLAALKLILSTMTISASTSALVGIIIECILYGVFLVASATTFHILLIRRKSHRTNVPLLFTAAMLFGLATAQMGVDIASTFQAFNRTNTAEERDLYFLDLTNPVLGAKHAIFFHMMLAGDAIVIYRCYVIYGQNLWMVVFPIICSLASAAISYIIIWAVVHPVAGSFVILHDEAWGTALFTLSLVANLYSVGLIAYRIWKVEERQGSLRSTSSWSAGRQSLMPIARIILESGALNAAYLITYIALLDSGSSALSVIADIAAPIVGLIFSMVIIQADLRSGKDYDRKMSAGAGQPESSKYSSVVMPGAAHSGRSSDMTFSATRVDRSFTSSSAPTFEMSFMKDDDKSDKKGEAI